MVVEVQSQEEMMDDIERNKLVREYGLIGIGLIPFRENGDNLPEADKEHLAKIRHALEMTHEEIIATLTKSVSPK